MASTEDPLSAGLFRLSQDIIEELENDDEIEPVDFKTSKQAVDLDYETDSISIQTTTERITKTAWQEKHIVEVANRAEGFDSYRQTLELLEGRTDKPARVILKQFVRSIINESLDGLDDSDVVSIITILISQIEGAPINWHPIAFLKGIRIGTEPIELPTGITLRQPTEEDLESDDFRDDRSTRFHTFEKKNPELVFDVGNTPYATIEFSTRAPSSDSITEIIDQHIILFRLFDVGSVEVISRVYNPEAVIIEHGRPRDTPTHSINKFSYTIEEDRSDEMCRFCNLLSESVMEKLVKGEPDTSLAIAYDRYQNALEVSRSNERKLTSAIMCLEALLLKESEHGELSERLSRRTGLLLDYFDLQPIKVSNKLRQAYGIRSKYVHGSKLDDDADINSLTNDVMEYARRIIVVFLQMGDDTTKADLLSKIDNAALHPNARDALHELLEEECEI